MARDVYSLRIFCGLPSPSSGVVGPVVPDDLVYIVRDIDVVASTGNPGDHVWILNQTTGLLWVVTLPSTPTVFAFQWRGRQVYGPGEQVGVHAVQGDWHVAISGYQLSLP